MQILAQKYPVHFFQYLSGNGKKGYLFSETSNLSVAKIGKLAKKIAFRSGCLRESLRFAFLAETFERVAGKDEIKIVQHIVDRRVMRKKYFAESLRKRTTI